MIQQDLNQSFSIIPSTNTDLNKGNNCAKNSISHLLQTNDRSILHNKSKLEEIINYFSQKYNYNKNKLYNVLKRLSKKDKCRKTGNVAYVESLTSMRTWFEYIPHSCGCESCAHCSKGKRKKFFIKVRQKIEYYLKQFEDIDFFTITYGKVEAEKLNEAYEDFSKKLRKLYSYRLTKKKIQKWKKNAYKELNEYLKNIKSPIEREIKRKKHTCYIEESFGKIEKAYREGATKLFSLFRYAILKIEITYKNRSFHIHVHGVAVRTFSRFVWVALLKELGFGKIFDIRQVNNSKAVIAYLSKYLLKADNLEFDNLEDEIHYEYCLYGRRKLREWGGEDCVIKEDDSMYEKEKVYVTNLKINVKFKDNVNNLKKTGKKCIAGEFEYYGEKYYLYVDEKGRFVMDDRFYDDFYEAFASGMFKILYKYTRKVIKESAKIMKESEQIKEGRRR